VYIVALLDQSSEGFNLSYSDNLLYSWASRYLEHTGDDCSTLFKMLSWCRRLYDRVVCWE